MAEGEGRSLKRTTIVSAALLAVHVVVVGWIFVSQARAWPHVGSWAYLLLYLAAPGIFFHAVRLVFLWRAKRAPRGWLVRLFTIPAGLVAATFLMGAASQLAKKGFIRAYEPFVAAVGVHLADPCGRAGDYFAIPAVAAYNARTGRRPTATLIHDARRFALAFAAGSIDVDGSTLYYDSKSRQWRLVHNDSPDGRAAFDQFGVGLAPCDLRAGP